MAQEHNSELVRNLVPYFHKRSDLVLNHAHAISFMRSIPGLVGLWLHGDRDISGYVNNLGGVGNIVTHVLDNNVLPYADYSNGNTYLRKTDHALFDITGSENYVDSSYKGLTMGGWWQLSASGTNESLITKWNSTGNQKAYRMYVGAAELMNITLSSNGSTNTNNLQLSFTMPYDTWFFCVGWWNPSTEIRLYYGLPTDNDLTMENTTSSVTATVFNSSAEIMLGAAHGGASDFLDGRSSYTFVYRGRVPDHHIRTIFDYTSPIVAATL